MACNYSTGILSHPTTTLIPNPTSLPPDTASALRGSGLVRPCPIQMAEGLSLDAFLFMVA